MTSPPARVVSAASVWMVMLADRNFTDPSAKATSPRRGGWRRSVVVGANDGARAGEGDGAVGIQSSAIDGEPLVVVGPQAAADGPRHAAAAAGGDVGRVLRQLHPELRPVDVLDQQQGVRRAVGDLLKVDPPLVMTP